MVSYVKRLEFQIKQKMAMPLRMFKLIQQAKVSELGSSGDRQQSKKLQKQSEEANRRAQTVLSGNKGASQSDYPVLLPFQAAIQSKLGPSVVHLTTEGEAASATPLNQLLNEELKSDEYRKIEKYAQLLGGSEQSGFDWCIVETILYQINQAEFF